MGQISGVSTADLNNIDGFFTTQGGGGTASTTPTISVSGGTFGSRNDNYCIYLFLCVFHYPKV